MPRQTTSHHRALCVNLTALPSSAWHPILHLRLASAIAIFPVIGHAGLSKNQLNVILKACLRSNIVRQDNDTTLTRFDADHGVGGLTVVAALEKAMPLRAIEDDDTQAGIKILALLNNRQVGGKNRELVG